MSTAPQGWQDPKINWSPAEPVGVSDFNRIEKNINVLDTGNRELDQTQAPKSNTGTLRQILDWIVNRIKAILGTTNWYDTPPVTLANAKDHIEASAPHTGHETPAGAQSKVNAHATRYDNPHRISPSQLGLNASLVRENAGWNSSESNCYSVRLYDFRSAIIKAQQSISKTTEIVLHVPEGTASIAIIWSGYVDGANQVAISLDGNHGDVKVPSEPSGPGSVVNWENELVVLRCNGGPNAILKVEITGAGSCTLQRAEYLDVAVMFYDMYY
mgnify:CR=1 FL=1|jgi:hypothetical protein